MSEGQEDEEGIKIGKSELTELKARDASCPKGKKMKQEKNDKN